MYIKDILLLGMILTYGYTIYNVNNYYKETDSSISSIIKDSECNSKVLTSMCVMGVFTIIYELLRYNILSFVSILLLLTGIYGVIKYDYTLQIHFFFCFIVFISILIFMYNNCYLKKNIFLFLLLYLQEIMGALTFLENNIINMEIYLLGNFALFYIYLHFL